MKQSPEIESLILTVRGRKVLIDADLAAIYAVPTKVLNQAVKRNRDRFPEDFVFRMNVREKAWVVTNCDHLSRLRFAKTLPFAFTEHGALMASMVLNSSQAVAMSVYVIRAFTRMRDQLSANAAIFRRLAEIEKTLLEHDTELSAIWEQLRPLLLPPPDPPRKKIGFSAADE
jgi:hypothetical protein